MSMQHLKANAMEEVPAGHIMSIEVKVAQPNELWNMLFPLSVKNSFRWLAPTRKGEVEQLDGNESSMCLVCFESSNKTV